MSGHPCDKTNDYATVTFLLNHNIEAMKRDDLVKQYTVQCSLAKILRGLGFTSHDRRYKLIATRTVGGKRTFQWLKGVIRPFWPPWLRACRL